MADSVVGQFPWLKNVDFYITTACDGSCADCMAYDLMEEEGLKYMDKQLYFGVMDQLEGIDSVHFAGIGDPFMHPDFYKMVYYAAKKVKEVRINTNGSILEKTIMDNDWKRVLPKNTHIYLSTDKYHEYVSDKGETLVDRICNLAEYCEDHRLGLTLNIRVLDKEKDSKDIYEYESSHSAHDSDDERTMYDTIINRVLRMGKAKSMKGARYVDLHKLLDDHLKNPMIGIMHDGTIISNFIAAYMPKSARPRIFELGNVTVNESSLRRSLKDYDDIRKSQDMHPYRDRLLRFVIDSMKSYPFVIEDPNEFDWDVDDLKTKKEEIVENTSNLIVDGIEKFQSPLLPHGTATSLVSVDGILRHDFEFQSLHEKWAEAKKSVYYNIFQNSEARKIVDKKIAGGSQVVKDRMLKLYLLRESLWPDMPGHGYMQDDEKPWLWGKEEFEKIGFTEDEWKAYLYDMVRRGVVERLFLEPELRVFVSSTRH